MLGMQIHIKNLRLRTIIGVDEWERERLQDVVVNVWADFDGSEAAASDDLRHSVDYRAMKRRIMEAVETSRYKLLEALAARVLELVLDDPRVTAGRVEIDKPHALRFADSVSVSVSGTREA
jgi:D-erythro-7,8-dihydroneopterin triphosphate epimerase